MEEEILEKLNIILVKLAKIEKDIEYLKKGNDNMSEHISFVDNVYTSVKNPFYYILNKIKPIDNIPEKPRMITNDN